MDFNKQGSLGGVAGDGGELVVLRNGTKVFSLNVPPPNFSAEKYRDSVVDNSDYFLDEFDNNYRIDVYSSNVGIDYNLEAEDIVNKVECRKFFDEITIEFVDNLEDYDKDEYEADLRLQEIQLQEQLDEYHNNLLSEKELNQLNVEFVEPKFNKDDFKSMRDGFVVSTNDYTIAHYEREEYRLIEVAEKIKSLIDTHFILYDYKGSIIVYDKEVEAILNAISDGGMIKTSDGDFLSIQYNENPPKSTVLNNYTNPKKSPRILTESKISDLFYQHLTSKGYLSSNLLQEYLLYDKTRIDFIVTNKKQEFLAAIEIKSNLNDTVTKQLLHYKKTIEDIQSLVPRIFLVTYHNFDLVFHELIDNTLKAIVSFPSYEQLSTKVNAKKYELNLISIATYGSDVPDNKKDCLDITADVDAFAKLVTYKKSSMPLSIGLFGKWGSGKSFFMKELRSKIKDYSKLEDEHFCQDIVHVKFNAWHYSDSNLWASLTYRIFEEIDKKFNKPEDKIHILYENLESSKNEILIKNKEKSELEEQITSLTNDIESYKTKLEHEKNELQSTELFDFKDEILKKPIIQKSLEEIKTKIGLKNEDIEDIKYLNYELKSWFEVFKRVYSDEKLTNLIFYISLFFIVIGSVIFFLQDELTYIFNALVTLIATSLVLIKKVLPKVKELKKARIILEDIIETWDKSQNEIRTLNYQKVKEKELLISEIEKNILIKERDISTIENKKHDIEIEIENIKSGKYFRDFIKSKVISSDYKKHLGLISLIRKDLTELEIFLSDKNKDKREFNIDRIILYIDDLDRCNDQLVVEVLEAIHLLLAFEIFVVVVGIDLRWIKSSLGSKYSVLVDDKVSLSSKDYIEKIFQIPFKVNNLNNDNKNNLINNLFNKDKLSYFKSKEEEQKEQTKSTITKNTLSNIIKSATLVEERKTTITTENKYLELELTKDEVEYINSLVNYINDLPRTINRFVNTYRVLRSHEVIQKALADNFYNFKTIVLFIIEIFWEENNTETIKFIDKFKDDYNSTFDNINEVKALIRRFKFDD